MTDNRNQLPPEPLTRDTAPVMAGLVLAGLFERNPAELGSGSNRHLEKIVAVVRPGWLRLAPPLAAHLDIETAPGSYSDRQDRAGSTLAAKATEHAVLSGITSHLMEQAVPPEVENPELALGIVAEIRRAMGELG